MKLYLIRHGDAYEFGDPRWPNDEERPLSPRGEEDARRVALALARLVSGVDQVVSSPILRAKQTAEIVCAELGWPDPLLIEEIAGGPPDQMLAALTPWNDTNTLAAVGHAPAFPIWASYLITGRDDRELIDMKKGAALCLSFEGALEAGAGVLEWLIVPKALPD